MTTQLNPPTPSPAPASPPPGRTLARTITIVGAGIAAAAIVAGTITAVAARGAEAMSHSEAVDGVRTLEVSTAAADVEVTFSDTATQARLDVTSESWQGVRDWKLERVGDTLRVADSHGWNLFEWLTWGGAETATLVLPASLEGRVDADLDVSAGRMVFVGDAREVDVDVSAGGLEFTGAATSMDAEVSAGAANITVDGARTISVDVSAGGLDLRATGTAPESIEVDVSAGDATLRVPDVTYAVTGDQSAGDRTITVRQDPSAARTIEASVSAGDLTIGPIN